MPFHACVFSSLAINTISVILVDDIEKNFFERKCHKLYEMLKYNENLWYYTNASINLKTMIKMCLISQYENIHY